MWNDIVGKRAWLIDELMCFKAVANSIPEHDDEIFINFLIAVKDLWSRYHSSTVLGELFIDLHLAINTVSYNNSFATWYK